MTIRQVLAQIHQQATDLGISEETYMMFAALRAMQGDTSILETLHGSPLGDNTSRYLLGECMAGAAVVSAAGSDAVFSGIAAQPLSAHRCLRFIDATQVNYASATAPGHSGSVAGVSATSPTAGAAVMILTKGVIESQGWGLVPGGVLFCGEDGVITQTYDPAWAWVQVIGSAISSTVASINVSTPIKQE